ncbi:hypothetical protein PHYSODRAFT_332417 [Phytophthora sojae]|uniref:Uncharacterized protein n=1 Tax=Phytophthora sojae (strain P6497) TaxID=1094619 RepID=G4ZHL2_PHYSP|nr:hypothetical protein PHYSODRAFT_332417 [Phytophthora sojae]EGZ18667.1 hypothetical protein PHYSODRAFT_332417 [Phytophthora sojae]|eukprot:XP_009527725.1 hypothetical protein PHYSODRAFT_332417 [Phytophthora sojae]
MDENGNWLLDTVNVAALHGAVPDVYQELTDGLLISSVKELIGRFGVAADNTTQLLVCLRQEPSTANATLPPAAQQRRGGDGDVGFSSLWNYPPFPTDQPNLPEPDELGGFLQRHLPVSVQVGRTPTNLFAEGTQEIVCGDLLARIDTFLESCVPGLPETSSEERWHLFYDQLIELSVHICRAKGMDINFVRNAADPTGTTFGTLRP